jgi:hypothetical protein
MVWLWRLQQCRVRQGFDVYRHMTVFRYIQRYAPRLGKLGCLHLKTPKSSYCVNVISFEVKCCWLRLYYRVNSTGVTIVSCSAKGKKWLAFIPSTDAHYGQTSVLSIWIP